jgi:hypothetical protein
LLVKLPDTAIWHQYAASSLPTLVLDPTGTCSTPESTTHPSGENFTHIALSRFLPTVIGLWRHKFALITHYLACMGLSSEQQAHAPWKLPSHQKQQQQEARRRQPFPRQAVALGLSLGGCVAFKLWQSSDSAM